MRGGLKGEGNAAGHNAGGRCAEKLAKEANRAKLTVATGEGAFLKAQGSQAWHATPTGSTGGCSPSLCVRAATAWSILAGAANAFAWARCKLATKTNAHNAVAI